MQTKAHREATARYNAKAYKRIELKLKPDVDTLLRSHVALTGESLNGFITRAIIAALDAAESTDSTADDQ